MRYGFATVVLAAFLALNRWHAKMTVVFVMAACGALGLLLQAAGIA